MGGRVGHGRKWRGWSMTEIVSRFELKLAVIAFIALVLVNQVVIAAAGADVTEAAGFQNQGVQPQNPEADTLANPQNVSYQAPENETASIDSQDPGETGFLTDMKEAFSGFLTWILPAEAVAMLNWIINGSLAIVGWFQELLSGWGYLISIAGWASPLVVVPQFVMTLVMVNPVVKLVASLSPL